MIGIPNRPRLRPSVAVVAAADGRLVVASGGGRGVALRDGDGRTLRLLDSLDGTRDLAAVASAAGIAPRDASDAVGDLVRLGFVEDPAAPRPAGMDDAYAERLDRQMAHLSDYETGEVSRLDLQERLRVAHVAVAGLGGCGAWACLCLAASGVGRITAIDNGRVESGDVSAMPLCGPGDVGRLRGEVVGGVLAHFNPAVEMRVHAEAFGTEDDLVPLLRHTALVISTASAPTGPPAGWVQAACRRAQVAHLAARERESGPVVGPLVDSWDRPRAGSHDAAAIGLPEEGSGALPAGGEVAMFAGSLAALEAVRYLLGVIPPVARDGVVVADLSNASLRRQDLNGDSRSGG